MRLGNPAAALDAYLRSSDLDPRFVPSRLRLVDHFWNVRRSGRRRRAGERPRRRPAVGRQRAGADRPPGDRDDDAARGRDVAFPVHARAGSGRRARDRRGRRPPGADRQPPDRGAGSDADPRAHLGGRRRRGDALRDADRHGPRGSGPARRGLGAGPVRRDGRPPRARERGLRHRGVRRPRLPGGEAHAGALPPPARSRPRPSPSAGRPTIPISSRPPGARWRASRRRCWATAPKRPRRSRPKAAACRRRAPPSCAGSAICSAAPPFIVVRDAERAPRRATSAAGCA